MQQQCKKYCAQLNSSEGLLNKIPDVIFDTSSISGNKVITRFTGKQGRSDYQEFKRWGKNNCNGVGEFLIKNQKDCKTKHKWPRQHHCKKEEYRSYCGKPACYCPDLIGAKALEFTDYDKRFEHGTACIPKRKDLWQPKDGYYVRTNVPWYDRPPDSFIPKTSRDADVTCIGKGGWIDTANQDEYCHGSSITKCQYKLKDILAGKEQKNLAKSLKELQEDYKDQYQISDWFKDDLFTQYPFIKKEIYFYLGTFGNHNKVIDTQILAYACAMPTTTNCPHGQKICPVFASKGDMENLCENAFEKANPTKHSKLNLDRYKQYLQGEFCYFHKNDKCPIYTTHTKNAGSREYYDRQRIRIPKADASSIKRAKEFARGYVEAYQSHNCTQDKDGRKYKFAIHRMETEDKSKDVIVETVGQCRRNPDEAWEVSPESFSDVRHFEDVMPHVNAFFIPKGRDDNKALIEQEAKRAGCKGSYRNGIHAIGIQDLNRESLGHAFVCRTDTQYTRGELDPKVVNSPKSYFSSGKANVETEKYPELAATMATMTCITENYLRTFKDAMKEPQFRLTREWDNDTKRESARACSSIYNELHQRFVTVPGFYLIGKDKFDPDRCRDDAKCRKQFITECKDLMNASEQRCDKLWGMSMGDLSDHLDFKAASDTDTDTDVIFRISADDM